MSTATLKLGGVHLAANALLLWVGYEWLGMAESTGVRLAASALYALAILALACWLYGATLVYFRSGGSRLNESFRIALRHLVPLVAAAAVVIAIYGLSTANFLSQPAFETASFLTLKLHKSVKPSTVMSVFRVLLWIVRWVVLPVALLPMASGIATQGWRGFREFTWRASWRYWIAVPVLLAASLTLPRMLLGWTPQGTFVLEFVSFSLRSLFAYVLLVGGLIGLCVVTSLPPWRRVPETARVVAAASSGKGAEGG
jgi:hypothetical protein